jgi:hypothetical protein
MEASFGCDRFRGRTMLRRLGFLVFGPLISLWVLSGCVPMPQDAEGIQSRARYALPIDDAETRFVARASYVNIRTVPTFLEALLVPGRQGTQSPSGVVAVTDQSIYFLLWDGRQGQFQTIQRISLISLIKIEPYSVPLILVYALNIETRPPPYLAREGSQLTGQYRIGVVTPFDTGSRDETRALCQEIARRRSAIGDQGEAPIIRCE